MPKKARYKSKDDEILAAIDMVMSGEGHRVFLDLIDVATVLGVEPEDFVPALQSGELVAQWEGRGKLPTKAPINPEDFSLRADTVIKWMCARNIGRYGLPLNRPGSARQ